MVLYVIFAAFVAIEKQVNITTLNSVIMQITDAINLHIERMSPEQKKERTEQFERLAKNLQPFIKPFFESGMGKD